jgi:hypothetical protein
MPSSLQRETGLELIGKTEDGLIVGALQLGQLWRAAVGPLGIPSVVGRSEPTFPQYRQFPKRPAFNGEIPAA